MIENGDFKFRDDLYNAEKGDTVPIEISVGPYAGIVYRYTQIGIKEDPENDEAVLRFNYDLLETKEFSETTLRNDERFTKHIGIILNHFLLETLEADQNELRENNTSKSDSE